MLAQESGLNTVQVSHWFNNARKRLLINDNYYRKGMGKGKRTTGKKVEAKNLQGQVQDALRARHERDAREQTLSAEIAAQHPIRFQDEVDYVYKFASNAAGLPRAYYNV